MNEARAFVVEALDAVRRAIDGRGELRNAQLATVTAQGYPALRTLVLRGLDLDPDPIAEAHCDARSAKVSDMSANGAAALLCWSPEEQLQVRLSGMAVLHGGDALARRRWDALSAKARQPYGLLPPPGEIIAAPNDGAHVADAERFALFTVIRIELVLVDVLRLAAGGGQTRAKGVFMPEGLAADWVGA